MHIHPCLWTVITVLLCHVRPVAAQESPQNHRPELPDRDVIERLLDPGNEDDASALIEEIEELARNPLCLRTADADDLAALPFLSPSEAAAVASVLADGSAGWSAIVAVLGGEPERLQLFRACAVLDCADATTAWGADLRSRLQQDDRARSGYLDGSYAGSRARLMQRLRLRMPAGIAAGIILEKDPGETSMADHLAGAVSFDGNGVLRRAVLGDFTVTSGQGLVFWQAFARSKSSEAARVGKSAPLVRPFVSASEGLAFRGAALQLQLGEWDAAAVYSSRWLDATIDDETGLAGSLGQNGLHRTESELRRRGTVREQAAGGVVQWHSRLGAGALLLGTSFVGSRFSLPSQSRSPFAFEGDEAWAAGAHARWSTETTALYAEAALAHTHVPAVLAGAELRLSPELQLALLYRRYHERFVSLYASAFGERSGGPQNEEGMYAGLRLRLLRKLRIDAWCDVFRIPNRTYFLHLPTSGGEVLLAAEYRFPGRTRLALRLRRERKDQTVAVVDAAGRDIRPLTARTVQSVRLQLQREFRDGLRVRLRAEYTQVGFDGYGEGGDGALLSMELRFRLLPALTCIGKLTGYSTDSYDARLYQFEHDVRGVMLNAVCYGEGIRAYLLAVLRAGSVVDIGMRYALTLHDGARSFGSDRDAVPGDRLGSLSLQVDLRL